MTIPDFQTLFLPFLKCIQDGKEHALAEVNDALANEFHLSQEDRQELLASGRQLKFDNRVSWTRTYLVKANLIEVTGRAKFRMTPRGRDVLGKKPAEINIKYLMQFPEFVEFHRSARQGGKTIKDKDPVEEENHQTPEERLETSYQSLRANLAQELLEKLHGVPAKFFEQLVVDLLVAMGYGGSRTDAGMAIGQSGDGGIDGIINEDKLGLDVVYIQAKRWEGTVGRPIVQAFAGSLEGRRARKGVLITTSKFTADAQEYVRYIEKRIVLIDGERLAQLMIDHNVGVTEVASYVVKRIDLDYFDEE